MNRTTRVFALIKLLATTALSLGAVRWLWDLGNTPLGSPPLLRGRSGLDRWATNKTPMNVAMGMARLVALGMATLLLVSLCVALVTVVRTAPPSRTSLAERLMPVFVRRWRDMALGLTITVAVSSLAPAAHAAGVNPLRSAPSQSGVVAAVEVRSADGAVSPRAPLPGVLRKAGDPSTGQRWPDFDALETGQRRGVPVPAAAPMSAARVVRTAATPATLPVSTAPAAAPAAAPAGSPLEATVPVRPTTVPPATTSPVSVPPSPVPPTTSEPKGPRPAAVASTNSTQRTSTAPALSLHVADSSVASRIGATPPTKSTGSVMNPLPTPGHASGHGVHIVRSGESLWSIAADRADGPPSEIARYWRELVRANETTLRDPDLLRPGQSIVVPNVDPNARNRTPGDRSVTRDTDDNSAEQAPNR